MFDNGKFVDVNGQIFWKRTNGGEGSGNFGHAGIPGQRGGSSSGGGGSGEGGGSGSGKDKSGDKTYTKFYNGKDTGIEDSGEDAVYTKKNDSGGIVAQITEVNAPGGKYFSEISKSDGTLAVSYDNKLEDSHGFINGTKGVSYSKGTDIPNDKIIVGSMPSSVYNAMLVSGFRR